MIRPNESFFRGDDPVEIARALLGKKLCSYINGILTTAMIVETEAYKGPEDKACHAYNNRLTPRIEVMYHLGGIAYVYTCYGIHQLFNIVTGPLGKGHAVLIRELEPLSGQEAMMQRRHLDKVTVSLCNGPGLLTVAMGIKKEHNGIALLSKNSPIWIEEYVQTSEIIASPRVGVETAGLPWSTIPWRFRIQGNKWSSPAK